MKFKSETNPTVETKEDLIILRSAGDDRRLLIPLPSTLEEAEAISRKGFSLKGRLRFETTEWPGFAGSTIQIHPSSWANATPLLREVIVTEVLEAFPDFSDSPRRLPPHHASTSNSATQLANILDLKSKAAASTSESQPRRSSALKRQSSSETSVIDLVDNPDDDQVDQADSEVVEVSPPEKSSRVIKGSGDVLSQKAGPSKVIARGGTSSKVTLPSPSQKRTREADAEEAPKPKVAKFRREVTTTVQGTSPPELTQPATQQSSAEGNSAGDNNLTYIVKIQYNSSDDYTIQSNLFKTRGKHLVSKVLKMACRTFEVTYNPEIVHLERLEECTDSFGAPDERRVRCKADGIMAETGLQQDALYELIVDED